MLHLFLQAVYSQNTDKDVRSWFRGDQFGQRIVDITKMLCHQCSTGDGDISDMRSTDCRWQLLKLAFASDDAMGMFVWMGCMHKCKIYCIVCDAQIFSDSVTFQSFRLLLWYS